MIVYFLLIGFASLFVSLEFIVDTSSPALHSQLLDNFQQFTRQQLDSTQVFQPIVKIRHKAILMVAIIMFVMVIVLTMFVRNISEPLQHMIDQARKISGGDLRQTVKVPSRNELAELANVINELSSNLQEAIMLSRNICSAGALGITELEALLRQEEPLNPEAREKARQSLELLRNEIGMLNELVDYFRLYSIDPK